MLFDLIASEISQEILRTYKRGDTIYHEGDSPDHLCLIKSGLVGLFHISESGKETFLRVFGDKSLLGHRSFFANDNYQGNAVALATSKVLFIPKTECERMYKDSPQLLVEITKELAKNLGEAELRLAGLQDKSVDKRIIDALVFLKSRYPEQTWTRKEIAEYAGTTFESVTRTMTMLDKAGHITKKGRAFSFVDIQKLIEANQNNLF